MNSPVRVAITGAAGQIGYQLCFRIAAGRHAGARISRSFFNYSKSRRPLGRWTVL